MNKIRKIIRNFLDGENAQGMVEYGLILALVSIVAIGALGDIGDKINNSFGGLSVAMGGEVEEVEEDGFESRHNRTIGRTGLFKQDVVTGLENKDHNISIEIPANSNISGQIKSMNSMTYGVYDADIRLPNNDGLLNGFFLYNRENSKGYEIDLEILYRDGKWQLWTTIFNEAHPDYKDLHRTLRKSREVVMGRGNAGLDGGEIFKIEQPLGFDPTTNFHNYKIDVSEDYILFIVDGTERSRWDGSFEMIPMNLFAGTFYPFWLNGNRPAYDSLNEDDQHSLKTKGYDAYRSDGVMLAKMGELFGRSESYTMDIKKVNIKRR